MIIDHLAGYSHVAKCNIKRENHLINDLYLDSLDKMVFVMWLETTFGIKITWKQSEELRTVGQAADLVVNYRAK